MEPLKIEKIIFERFSSRLIKEYCMVPEEFLNLEILKEKIVEKLTKIQNDYNQGKYECYDDYDEAISDLWYSGLILGITEKKMDKLNSSDLITNSYYFFVSDVKNFFYNKGLTEF